MRLLQSFLVALFGLLIARSAHAHSARDDAPDDRVVPRYPEYPYAEHTRGYVRRVPVSESGEEGTKLWSARISAEGGYLGDQGWSAGGRVLLRYWRLGVSADAQYHGGWSGRRPFYLGTAAWTVDLVMRPHFNLRAGPGLAAQVAADVPVGGRPSYDYGPTLMTEIDIIPIHPVVANARFDVGRIGDLAAVSGRVSVGVMIRRAELFVAYEAKRVGDLQLRGPRMGLRLWF